MHFYFRGKKLDSEEDLKNNLLQFFDEKDQNFFEKGIFNLIERWKDVLKTNEKYI